MIAAEASQPLSPAGEGGPHTPDADTGQGPPLPAATPLDDEPVVGEIPADALEDMLRNDGTQP